MSFVNPLFYMAMLVVAVPVLLHLIKRERARKIEFPTLMFLRRVSRKTIRYQKLRHLLLLFLRVMALGFLVLAFTRPYRTLVPAAAYGGRKVADHIILLDNSMSMGYGDRWAEARKAAEKIIRGLDRGDRVALLEFSDRTTVLFPLTNDLETVRDQGIPATELTDRPTRYAQALKAAVRLGDGASGDCILHLISDFQKTGLAAEEREFRIGSGFELECIDVGTDDYSNITLGQVAVIESVEGLKGGSALRLRFPVINFGTQERKNTRIRLSVDGRTTAEAKAALGKGDVRELEFQVPGLTSGLHEIVIEADDPQLPRDNRYALTIEARSRTPVLAVEDSQSSTLSRGASYFLSRALNISALSRYQVAVASLGDVEASGAFSSPILIWNNASGGAAVLQNKLQEFVQQGGGLIIVVSDGARANDFNRSFGRWLPLRIETSSAQESRVRRGGGDYLLLTYLRLDHPIFEPFREPHSGNFSGARFYRCAHLVIGDPAEALARFDNGLPALVSVQRGKGRVLVYASSADDSANDLPLTAVYAPLWQQMLRFLDQAGDGKRAVQVGDTIDPRTILLESAQTRGRVGVDSNQAVVVLDPDRTRVQLPKGDSKIEVDKTGFYAIRSSDITTSVAVNPVPRESDLTHGDVEEISAAWAAREPTARPTFSGDEQTSPEEQDRRQKIWRYLLAAVFVCIVAEGLFSNLLTLKPE